MSGTLRERKPGVWELRARSGRDPLTGQYRQVSRTFHGSKREANLALAKLVTEVSERGPNVGGRTVGALLDEWLAHAESLGRSQRTLDGYRSIVQAHLRPAFGSVQLRKLRAEDLDRFYRALAAKGRSPLTVRHCHAALSAALRQGVKWGWIDRPPTERATPPPVPRVEIEPPSVEEIATVLRELERNDHDLASMVYVAATTGARRGELCALRWRDVDLDQASLVVARSIADTTRGLIEKDPKTHRSRRLTLDPSTVAVLRRHREKVSNRAALADAAISEDAFVWSQEVDATAPWRPDRVTGTFRGLRQRLGLDRVNFHHLRHFSATALAGAGIDVRTIAGRLGHADPSITLRTYAHFLEAADRNAAEVMAGLAFAAERAE